MVQFTYVPLTLCKLFPTLKRNPEFISSCRNVHIDHTSISFRGIFNWIKIEGEKGFDIVNLAQLPYMELQNLRLWLRMCVML